MKIYVLLIEDRHADVDAEVYSSKEEAIVRAKSLVVEYAHYEEDIEEITLTQGMVDEGWAYHAKYSCESDSITVLERELK